MSNIHYLESMVDHYWPEMHKNFPAIEKPQIVPAATLRGMAPVYMKSYIDLDPESFYMFIKADPLQGDASRDMAVEFFDDFFYRKMKMPSSYDIKAGGDLPREEAVSKEVLPSVEDILYKKFFDEQQAKIDAEAKAQELEAKKQKLGFDPTSDDIIDIDDDGNVVGGPTTAVGSALQTAVGLPLKIWYAVDFHISAGGNQLGYGGAGKLGKKNYGYLYEKQKKGTNYGAGICGTILGPLGAAAGADDGSRLKAAGGSAIGNIGGGLAGAGVGAIAGGVPGAIIGGFAGGAIGSGVGAHLAANDNDDEEDVDESETLSENETNALADFWAKELQDR